MDKASGYEPEDCGFKSHQLCFFIKINSSILLSVLSIEFSNYCLTNLNTPIISQFICQSRKKLNEMVIERVKLMNASINFSMR